MNPSEEVREIERKLAEPFPPDEVKFRPIGSAWNGTIEVAAFVAADAIVLRLNKVLGLGGWQDEYETLTQGEVRCKLRVKVAGEWITRSDCGALSKQEDIGDQCKAAHSDALKRAAGKFGVGLYLRRLKGFRGKYDGKKVTEWPALPMWAIPPECMPAGKELGTRVLNLLRTCCEDAKCSTDEAAARLLERFGEYGPKVAFTQVQVRDARDMLQHLNQWVADLKGKSAGKGAA